ncbi:MAG: hypothetical protein J4F40_19625 [Alphaproteobacteria bacterium]|nr:hypothetical protein [Alphaproteobacteria bacterium]
MTPAVIIYSDLHTNRIEPEMRVQRAVAVPVLFLLVMAFIRRAADFPLHLDFHLIEVDGHDVAAVGIGDVHRLANHDECGTVGLTWLDQSHGLDQFAVMSVQRVQHAVSVEYV